MGKIKLYIALFSFLAGIPNLLQGQILCEDCDCIIENARSAAAATNFQLALRQYNAAKLCDTTTTFIKSVDKAIVDLFVQINNLKVEAENNALIAQQVLDSIIVVVDSARTAAEKETKDALIAARKARDDAEGAKEKAETAEIEATKQAQIAESQLAVNEINKLILDKRHHEALEKVELAKKDSLGVEGYTIITNTIENFKNAGERLLWRRRKGDIQLTENRGIYLSPMLAIVTVDSSGRAHIVSNATGKSFLIFDTKSTYLGGAFSKNGTKLALYNNQLVHQFDVGTTTDTAIASYPFRYSNLKKFQAQQADITGVQFSEDDSLYVLKDTTFFSFSEPGRPIYAGEHKIIDLEPAIVLPVQNPKRKRKRKRKKGSILRKAIITIDAGSSTEKRLILSKRTRLETYVAWELPITVGNYSQEKILFGPNQQFLITDEGEYLDFSNKKLARFTNSVRSLQIINANWAEIDSLYNANRAGLNIDDLYVAAPFNRIITKNRVELTVSGTKTFRDELTVRKLDGWIEVTLAHPEGDTILGFDLIPKQVNLDPWKIKDQEIPEEYYLLSHTDTNLSIWDWKSGNLISQANISSGRIKQVIVSADGRFIMLTTENDQLEIWRLGTYEDIQDNNLIIAVTEQINANQENEN